MTKALCDICKKPVGPNDHPNAKVSHMACAMEQTYGAHGKDPAESIHAESYKRACEMRARQVRES